MTKINSTLGKLVESKTGGNKSKFAKLYLHDDRPTNLENWMGGQKSPTVDKLEPVFEIKNLNLNWFFRNEGEMYLDDNKEAKIELELAEAKKEIKQKDDLIEFYKDIIKNTIRKDVNFQTGDTNRQLADDILMMLAFSPEFNKGFHVSENEIN